MRISDILRVVENRAIAVGSKVAAATAELAREVDVERKARNLYAAAYGAQKREAMNDFRAIVEAQDAAAQEQAVKALKTRKRKAS